MRVDEFICCPRCKGDLLPRPADSPAEPDAGGPGGCACAACGLEYPGADGVVDFLPDAKGAKGLAQKLMESRRMVELYEGKWWRASKLFAPFMGITLNNEIALIRMITAPGPAEAVLDLACGPGIYARAFAQDSPARTVFGLDLSWPMLKYAARKAESLGLENITFMHGDAHFLPFRDSSLDVANCCGALHLFRDIRQVLGELARVLRPGGRFSAAMAMRSSKPLNRLKAYLDEKFWRIHYFQQAEIKELFDEAGFVPTVHHARGVWMIAGGVRRP